MTVDQLNHFCKGTFVDFLGITITELGDDFIKAQMDIDSTKHQPAGMMHGGVSLSIAETLAGAGSISKVDPKTVDVLGMQVSGNHVGSIKSGTIYATGQLIHHGNTTHIWDVTVLDETGRKLSMVRVVNLIKAK